MPELSPVVEFDDQQQQQQHFIAGDQLGDFYTSTYVYWTTLQFARSWRIWPIYTTDNYYTYSIQYTIQ